MVPAARTEQEANWRTPQHYEQPRLVAADGAAFSWPEGKPHVAKTEAPVFLTALAGNRVLAAAAVELYRDNTQLQQEQEVFAAKAEKFDRQQQQKQDSYYRQKEADLEGWRERERVRRADYRARKRQEAQSREVQTPKDTLS